MVGGAGQVAAREAKKRGSIPLVVVRRFNLLPEVLTRKRNPSRVASFMRVTGVSPRHPQRDSNPCYRRERAGSWAARRWGPETRISIRDPRPTPFSWAPDRSGKVLLARSDPGPSGNGQVAQLVRASD